MINRDVTCVLLGLLKMYLAAAFWIQFNSIQDYLYSAVHDTIVAELLYRNLSFYNRFIYCRNLTYLTYGKLWLILYIV